MAQLKEDEWPEDHEPTTTEREERNKNALEKAALKEKRPSEDPEAEDINDPSKD